MAEPQIVQWKRLSIEAVAIVASILFAFAIDAWWDERKERQYEQDALLGLESEYEDHRKTIDRQISTHKKLLGAVGYLMQACQSGTYSTSDMSLDDAIFYLFIPITTDLGSGVRDSLISGGKIEILSNPELRYALSAWDSVLDEVIDGQIFSRNLIRETFIPLVAEMGCCGGHGWSDKSRHPWPVSTRPVSTIDDMQERLFANETFCSLLDYRYAEMNHTLDEYEDLSQAILEILAMIRGSLGESAS